MEWKDAQNWQELEHGKNYLIAYQAVCGTQEMFYGIGCYHRGQNAWSITAWRDNDGMYTGYDYFVCYYAELPEFPKQETLNSALGKD